MGVRRTPFRQLYSGAASPFGRAAAPKPKVD